MTTFALEVTVDSGGTATVLLADVALCVRFYDVDEGWTEEGIIRHAAQQVALRLAELLGFNEVTELVEDWSPRSQEVHDLMELGYSVDEAKALVDEPTKEQG